MSYTYQKSNGNVVETRGDKVYFNGREITTGNVKPSALFLIYLCSIIGFFSGLLVGAYL